MCQYSYQPKYCKGLVHVVQNFVDKKMGICTKTNIYAKHLNAEGEE